MSRDYRRASRKFSFFIQRPVLTVSDSPTGETIDATRMGKTYRSLRVGSSSAAAAVAAEPADNALHTESGEELQTEAGITLVTES